MPPPKHGASTVTRKMKTNSLLRIFLFITICLLAIAPIVLHHHLEYSNGHLLDEKRLPGWSASPKLNGLSHIKTVQHDPNKTEFLTLALDYDEHRSNILLPPDIGRAGSFLLENALRPRPVWDEAIDPVVEHERCKQYFPDNNDNKGLYTANQKRRRIFLGSLIADDSWHTLAAIAMESYGIYTAVVFVESNRTQTGDARTLRFVNGTVDHQVLAESNLFGPNTAVHMDQFFFEGEIDGGGLIREHRQRDVIFKLWKQAGMTDEDVGVLSDADETPSRDFLRAIQICDIPQLRVQDQNCHSPKLVVSSMVFEGSPECMTVTRKWMHPDFMLGKCIEHVGDDKFRLTASQRQREFAWRRDKFSAKFNYSDWPREKNLYPLWNPADFRRDTGGFSIMFEDVDYLPFRMGHTGFHFHNYFETTQQLRTKYMTYGHPVRTADQLAIGEIHPDLDLMVDCVLGRSTTNNKHSTLSKRIHDFEGRIPIAYQLKGYTTARHMELKSIISSDEMGHNGTWHENEKAKLTNK